MNEHRTAREGERPRIDLEDEASVEHWTETLAVTRSQLEESVARVGTFADDVEMDLKGARTSTLADQVDASDTAA